MKLSWANRITHSRRGFTIVELLVVVAVIAILATVVVVSYNGVTKSAETSTLKANLTSLEKKLAAERLSKGNSYTGDMIQENLYTESSGNITRYRYGTIDSYCIESTGKNGLVFHLNTQGGNSQIKEDECPPLEDTTVQLTCMASKAFVTPKQTNYTSETLTLVLSTAYGSNTSTLAPGDSKFQRFDSRAASIDRGFATITLTGMNGSTFSATHYYAYEPKSC